MDLGWRHQADLADDAERDAWIAAEYARRLGEDVGANPAAVYLDVIGAWEDRAAEPEALEPLRRRKRRRRRAAELEPRKRRPAAGALPGVLFEAATAEDRTQRFVVGTRDAIARGVRAGFGAPRHDLFAGALAANDLGRADQDRPPLETIEPAVACAALALHGAVDGLRRTLGAPDDRADVLSAITRAGSEPGEPLTADVRARVERELGWSFAHVRVHTGAAAGAAAGAIGARAFTLGSHIYFADGELAPGTDPGDALLRHELTHVIQHDKGGLRSQTGGLEIEAPDSAAEHEARAAERAPAPPAPRAPPPGPSDAPAPAPAPASGQVIAGSFGDRARNWGTHQLLGMVEQVSPELAEMIRRGPGNVMLDAVKKKVAELLSGMMPGNPLARLARIGNGIADLGGILVGVATGDAACCATFAAWCKGLGAWARKAASSDFVKELKQSFGAIDTTIALIIRIFGGTFVDSFRGPMIFLDVTGFVIAESIKTLATISKVAADLVLHKLGVTNVAEIDAWLRELSEQAWAQIKEGAAGGIAGLKEVGAAIVAASGLEPMIESFQFAFQLIEVTDWLIAHRDDPDLAKNARDQMAHTFLPALIDGTAGLRERLALAWTAAKTTLTTLSDVLARVAPLMVGFLLPLAPILLPLAAFVRQVWPKVVPVLEQLGKDVKALSQRIYHHAKPVIEVFLSASRLAAMPWAAPAILTSAAWLVLPDCYKGPILDLMLDLMIAGLEALPESTGRLGPWRFVKTGAISFLARGRDAWSADQKVTAVNRVARLVSGASVDAIAGFVVGFGKGLLRGAIDPFKMIFDILKIGWDLSVFFAKLVNHAPQLKLVIEKHLPLLQANAEKFLAAGRQALDDFMAGRLGFEAIWELINSFMDQIAAQAGSIGASIADKLMAYLSGAGTEYEIAEALGIAIGFIIMFAMIVYFSGGAFAEAKGVVGVVAQIARILNVPYELLGKALEPLTTLLAPVLGALAAFGTRLGLRGAWEGAMKGFQVFVQVLGRLVEDILLAIEGRFVERTVQELIGILGRRIGQELATKLVDELGAKGAEAVIERLGEDTIKRLSTLGGDALLRLSLKLDSATITRMLDAGWTPVAIERLGLALDKGVIQTLLADGLTGPQVERLALLSAEKLASTNAATLQRLAVMPEPQFTRLSELGDAAFQRFVELPPTTLAKFGNLDAGAMHAYGELARADAAVFQKFTALSEREIASFGRVGENELLTLGQLEAPELRKLSQLGEEGLKRLATLDETGMRRLAAMELPTLQKLEALTNPAFDKLVELSRVDAPAFQKLAALDATSLEAFGALDRPALQKLTALDAPALAKFEGLDAAALRRFAGLEPEQLAKFASLRYPDMVARYGACELEGLQTLANLDAAALERIGGWDAKWVKNISRLEKADIELISKMKIAPGQAVEGALSDFASEQFRMGSEVFALDRKGMAHILERHHPQYWEGSIKVPQSFLDPKMAVSEVQDAIRAVMQQNRQVLIDKGTTGMYQITGDYAGKTYVLGINEGRVGQFYPR